MFAPWQSSLAINLGMQESTVCDFSHSEDQLRTQSTAYKTTTWNAILESCTKPAGTPFIKSQTARLDEMPEAARYDQPIHCDVGPDDCYSNTVETVSISDWYEKRCA